MDGSAHVTGRGKTFRRPHPVDDEGMEMRILICGICSGLLPLMFELALELVGFNPV